MWWCQVGDLEHTHTSYAQQHQGQYSIHDVLCDPPSPITRLRARTAVCGLKNGKVRNDTVCHQQGHDNHDNTQKREGNIDTRVHHSNQSHHQRKTPPPLHKGFAVIGSTRAADSINGKGVRHNTHKNHNLQDKQNRPCCLLGHRTTSVLNGLSKSLFNAVGFRYPSAEMVHHGTIGTLHPPLGRIRCICGLRGVPLCGTCRIVALVAG